MSNPSPILQNLTQLSQNPDLLSKISIVIILILWLAAIYYLRKIYDLHLQLMFSNLLDQLSQLYFCSYTLRDVYLLEFFPRYRQFVDWGFCGPVAGMSMLALKNNKTARYVYAYASKNHYQHCWVEFRYHGLWYVIDPCWSTPFVCLRHDWYKRNKPKIIKTCKYNEFWSYPISHQFYEKMRCPESSWLLCELMYAYNFEAGNDKQLFDPGIKADTLPEETGYHLNPWLHYRYPEIIFSRRIMHEMMQRPNRKRPTAHRIRKVRWYQRQVKAAYEQYQREHPKSA